MINSSPKNLNLSDCNVSIDEDNVENQKLLDAIYNLDVHTFKLNYAIDKKRE